MKTTISTIAILAVLGMVVIHSSPAQAKPCWLEKGDACKGPQGDPGPAGPQGAPGPTGPQGPKGDKGDQGIAGLDGKDGVDGKDGIDGKDGLDGAPGAKGEQGIAGKDGRDGKDFDPSAYQEGLATIGALHIPHVERNFAASLIGGFYNDKTAVGIGAGARFDETWQLGGSLAISTNGGDLAGKAAITGQW